MQNVVRLRPNLGRSLRARLQAWSVWLRGRFFSRGEPVAVLSRAERKRLRKEMMRRWKTRRGLVRRGRVITA